MDSGGIATKINGMNKTSLLNDRGEPILGKNDQLPGKAKTLDSEVLDSNELDQTHECDDSLSNNQSKSQLGALPLHLARDGVIALTDRVNDKLDPLSTGGIAWYLDKFDHDGK